MTNNGSAGGSGGANKQPRKKCARNDCDTQLCVVSSDGGPNDPVAPKSRIELFRMSAINLTNYPFLTWDVGRRTPSNCGNLGAVTAFEQHDCEITDWRKNEKWPLR